MCLSSRCVGIAMPLAGSLWTGTSWPLVPQQIEAGGLIGGSKTSVRCGLLRVSCLKSRHGVLLLTATPAAGDASRPQLEVDWMAAQGVQWRARAA